MNILEIIEKKKLNKQLNEKEIEFFIKEYVLNKTIKDYQASSLLMAMRLNGLSIDETYFLTKVFMETSELYHFTKNSADDISIDKHSSGGVGDKVSIILVPILVALGYTVPKISGRGLGHTGGTIDKLESINVNTEINFKDANKIYEQAKCIILAQNDKLVPADKQIYTLRDVTGTVDSPGLMTSSILSKKFVINSDFIFIDLKIGSGALITTLEEGEELANLMVGVAKKMNRNITVTITAMDKPLGRAIGNFLEVKESADFLLGKSTSENLNEIISKFAIEILLKTKKAKTEEEAKKLFEEVITSGKAYNCFLTWIKAQNGHYDETMCQPKYVTEIIAKHSGYLNIRSAHEIGMISLLLGAGRTTKEESIDMSAGIYLDIQDNEYVKQGQTIAHLYSSIKEIDQTLIDRFNNNIDIVETKMPETNIFVKVIST